MKKVAIVQSNYIPWKGYFDLIAAADEFILLDDVQFTRRDWRNRNRIKTPDGLKWLTVPVEMKGNYHQPVKDTRIAGVWADAHWRALIHNYGRARHFAELALLIEPLYLERKYEFLSDLNATFIAAICTYLGIETKVSRSSDYQLVEGRTERLAFLCEQAAASAYISGPAARIYLETEKFTERDIAVEWFDYSGYPEYPQLWGDFEHPVTILDLLFNCGKNAANFMKCVCR